MTFKPCTSLSRWCWKIQGRGAPRACCTVWSNLWPAVDEVFSSIGGRSSRPHFSIWQLFCTFSFGNIDIIGEKFGHWLWYKSELSSVIKKSPARLSPFSEIYRKLKVLQKIVTVVVLSPTTFVVALLRHYRQIFWHIFLWARSMPTLKFGGLWWIYHYWRPWSLAMSEHLTFCC